MGHKSTPFTEIRKIIIGNKIINFSKAQVMGIINITPDSFFDGGKYNNIDDILRQTERLLADGANLLDIGAVSTRPGAADVSENEELDRIVIPVNKIAANFPEAIISVDTWRAKVARETIAAGAHIINDISGGMFDNNMFNAIAELNVPYILMHIHGDPQSMQVKPIESNAVDIVTNFFREKVEELTDLGVENIILDPGFGFGKSLESNYNIMNNLEKTRINNLPILSGISRKSMINKVLNTLPSQALNGTTVLNTISLMNGANILRVHDVKQAVEAVKLFEILNQNI